MADRRRRWCATLAGLALAAGLPSVLAAEAVSPDAGDTRPNIVFILADDLGFTDIAPFGSEVQTPTLSEIGRASCRERV